MIENAKRAERLEVKEIMVRAVIDTKVVEVHPLLVGPNISMLLLV